MIDRELTAELTRTFGAALDADDPLKARRELISAGWLDALEHDEATAVAVVFRLQGAHLRDAAALDDVILHHLARRWADVAGDVAVAYPVGTPGGDGLTHIVLPGHAEATSVLWVSDLAAEHLRLIALDGDLAEHVVGGVDVELGLLGLRGRPTGETTRLTDRGGADSWNDALAAGRIAVAHQLVAGSHALLAKATAYAAARKQFGTPIGTFQAVKHRLAETLVAVSSADAAVVAAASTLQPTTAAVAKALAGRAAALAGKHCLQVFGGIGVTTEHEFHRYFRRNLVLDRLLGGRGLLEQELGKALRRGLLSRERLIELDQEPAVDLIGPVNPEGSM